jgi:ABC-2 type transport system ATP-binding protein
MEMIKFSNVSKIYNKGILKKEVVALNDVTLSIKKGEVFGFIGPNGAGKSTAIKILAGIIFLTSGSVTIGGIPISDPSSRKKLGFLPESPRFYDYLSAFEFMKLISTLLNVEDKSLLSDSKIYELLDIVGLKSVSKRVIRSFSLGMVQRLGIAQALLGDPEVLLLDEPLSSLDPFGRRDIMNVLKDLKDKGKTIFLSSHIIQDIEKIATRIAVIKNGSIVARGEISEITKKTSLEEFFVHETN